MHASLRSWLLWSLPIILAALAVYLWPALHADFVSVDDGLLITKNMAVHELTLASLTYNFTHYDPELYIPLTFLSYQLEYLFFGLQPWIYHLTNLLLHIGSAVLVLVIARRLTGNKLAALCAGLFFVLHPLNTEAVMWASGRKDLLSTFFFLLSLVAFLQSKHSHHSRRWFWISLGCFVLALLSKVSIIVLPAIFLLIDWTDGTLSKKRTISYWPFAIAAFVFAAIAVFGKTNTFSHSSPGMILLLSAKSIVYYLHRIVVPLHLTMFYPQTTPVTLASAEFFVPVILVIALLIGLVFLARFSKNLALGWLFFLIALLPDLLHYSKNEFVFYASDRYAYVGTIGIALGFAALLVSLSKKRPQREKPIMLLCICLFAWYGWTAQVYATVWQTNPALYGHAIQEEPTAWMPYNNYGTFLMQEGKPQEALAQFQKAQQNNAPKTPLILTNIGVAYNTLGDTEKAKDTFRQAIAVLGTGSVTDPQKLAAYYMLGELHEKEGNDTQALQSFKDATVRAPGIAEAHYNLGIQYEKRGRLAEAEGEYAKAVALDAHFPDAQLHLADVLAQQGSLMKSFSQLVKLKAQYPNYPGLQELYDRVREAMHQ